MLCIGKEVGWLLYHKEDRAALTIFEVDKNTLKIGFLICSFYHRFYFVDFFTVIQSSSVLFISDFFIFIGFLSPTLNHFDFYLLQFN